MAKITIEDRSMTIKREPGDPKFHGGGWGSGDSSFLHWLKKELNANHGYSLIKKLMYKDGHLVSDNVHYLRTAKKTRKTPACTMIWDPSYAVRSIAETWNKMETVRLEVVKEPWSEKVKDVNYDMPPPTMDVRGGRLCPLGSI